MTADHERALEACERDLRRLNRSPATITSVLVAARSFLARVGRRPVGRLRLDDVRTFLAAQDVRPSTVATLVSRLRCFFQALLRLGLVKLDPTARLPLDRPPPAAPLLLTVEQVADLLAAAWPRATNNVRVRARALRDRVVIELLYCGLRSSEVRLAQVGDLDPRRGELLVRRAKGGRPDLLPLPRPTLVLLQHYLAAERPRLARGRDQGRLVVGDDGAPVRRATNITAIVNRVARRAGVRCHPHALRRAVASHLAEAGVPMPLVQRYLGHARIGTTQVYVEVERVALHRAVKVLDLS